MPRTEESGRLQSTGSQSWTEHAAGGSRTKCLLHLSMAFKELQSSQLAFPVFPELPTSYLRLPEQKLESGYSTLPPVADTGTQSTRCLTKHRLSLWILLSTVLSVATPIALSWQARRNPFAIPHSKGCRLVPIPASDCIPFSFFPSAWTCMCAC